MSRQPDPDHKRRLGTVYDAVAGRLGANGFLTPEQLDSTKRPHGPQEVLLRSIKAPDNFSPDLYDADQRLEPRQILPESDLVKAVHAYTSDFYAMATMNNGQYDFQSLDETALLAFGILLEEAAREMLGETGDMALVEPDGLENGLPETKMTKYQVKGRVKPQLTPDEGSEASEEKLRAKKKRRATSQEAVNASMGNTQKR